jgi:hypothetical protein
LRGQRSQYGTRLAHGGGGLAGARMTSMREGILLLAAYVGWLLLSRRVLSGSADAFKMWGRATANRRLRRHESSSSPAA